MSTFFSKENIHRAMWSLLGAGVAGLFGLAYTKINGPSRVVLDTSTGRIPLQVTVQQPSESAAMAAALDHMAGAVEKLKRDDGASSNQQLQALTKQVKTLQGLVSNVPAKSQTPTILPPTHAATSSSASVPATASATTAALLQAWTVRDTDRQPEKAPPVLTFDFPAKVKGYTQSSLIGTGESSCPIGKMTSGTPIQIGFDLSDASLITRASPLFVTINRVDDATHLTQISEHLYALKAGPNVVTVNSVLQPGKYNVTYGFYLRSEIDAEFPKLHGRTCKVEISA